MEILELKKKLKKARLDIRELKEEVDKWKRNFEWSEKWRISEERNQQEFRRRNSVNGAQRGSGWA